MQVFESIDDIERHFGRRIKASEDDEEKRSLALEQREAIADFKEKRAAAATLEAHRTTVIAREGFKPEVAEYLTGNTPEEIDASAARWKVVSAPAAAADEDAAARAAYGNSGAGGGAPAAKKDELAEELSDIAKRFNESTRGSKIASSPSDSPATVNARELEKYAKTLLSSRVTAHLAKNSSLPAMRDILSRVDPVTLKEK